MLNNLLLQLKDAYSTSPGFKLANVEGVDGDVSDDIWNYQLVYELDSNATSQSVNMDFQAYLDNQEVSYTDANTIFYCCRAVALQKFSSDWFITYRFNCIFGFFNNYTNTPQGIVV